MTYSFSYLLPNNYKEHEHMHVNNYNNHMQLYGMKQIAGMMHRDFKYSDYGIDHWSGGKQYRIELVVLNCI